MRHYKQLTYEKRCQIIAKGRWKYATVNYEMMHNWVFGKVLTHQYSKGMKLRLSSGVFCFRWRIIGAG